MYICDMYMYMTQKQLECAAGSRPVDPHTPIPTRLSALSCGSVSPAVWLCSPGGLGLESRHRSDTFFLNFGKKGELKDEIGGLKGKIKAASKEADAAGKAVDKSEQALERQQAAAAKDAEKASAPLHTCMHMWMHACRQAGRQAAAAKERASTPLILPYLALPCLTLPCLTVRTPRGHTLSKRRCHPAPYPTTSHQLPRSPPRPPVPGCPTPRHPFTRSPRRPLPQAAKITADAAKQADKVEGDASRAADKATRDGEKTAAEAIKAGVKDAAALKKAAAAAARAEAKAGA